MLDMAHFNSRVVCEREMSCLMWVFGLVALVVGFFGIFVGVTFIE